MSNQAVVIPRRELLPFDLHTGSTLTNANRNHGTLYFLFFRQLHVHAVIKFYPDFLISLIGCTLGFK